MAGDEAYLRAKFHLDPSVWPQYTNVTDRQDRQAGQDRATVRLHKVNRFTNDRPKILLHIKTLKTAEMDILAADE